MNKLLTLLLLTASTTLLRAQAPHSPQSGSDPIHASRSTIYLLDSTRTWVYDTLQMRYNDSRRRISVFDSQDNNIRYYTQRWNGTAWVNSSNYLQTFDANKNPLTLTSQTWSAGTWVNSQLYTSTYDAQNNLTSKIVQQWNGAAWDNSVKDSFVYNASNENIAVVSKAWNGAAWINSSLTRKTFNTAHNITYMIDSAWSQNMWKPSFRQYLFYTPNGLLRLDSTQSWITNAWVNSLNFVTNYDANNNPSEYYNYGFDQMGQPNALTDKTVYQYYPYDYLASYSDQIMSGNRWVPIDSVHYYYHQTVAGIDQPGADAVQLSIYPNPSSGSITVNTDIDHSDALLELYSIQGKLLLHQSLTEPVSTISTADLSAGIYLVKVQIGNKSLGAMRFIKN